MGVELIIGPAIATMTGFYLFTAIRQQDVVFSSGDGSFALFLVSEVETSLFILNVVLEFVLGWFFISAASVSAVGSAVLVVAVAVLGWGSVLVGWGLLVAVGALAVEVVEVLG